MPLKKRTDPIECMLDGFKMGVALDSGLSSALEGQDYNLTENKQLQHVEKVIGSLKMVKSAVETGNLCWEDLIGPAPEHMRISREARSIINDLDSANDAATRRSTLTRAFALLTQVTRKFDPGFLTYKMSGE